MNCLSYMWRRAKPVHLAKFGKVYDDVEGNQWG